MKKAIKYLIYVFLFVFSSSSFAELASALKPYALIYSGPNTCEGCPEAIADIARKAHLPVKYVNNPKLIPSLLSHAALFAIGGTEDNIDDMHRAFNKTIVSSIQQYVKKGGRYLGICGGAFIAATDYMPDKNSKVKGFDIIPAFALDYSDTSKAHLETVTWYGKKVSLFFQGGPTFILANNAKNITIIARYENGDIAAFEYLYGKGKVIVIGPHPEADKTWLIEDKIDPTHWKNRQDLALDVIRKLLSN